MSVAGSGDGLEQIHKLDASAEPISRDQDTLQRDVYKAAAHLQTALVSRRQKECVSKDWVMTFKKGLNYELVFIFCNNNVNGLLN
jgi:hypothetical protein